MSLTPKQARFVEEYLIDLNATQAAIRAGYSEATARHIGSENLAKPDIQEAIQEAQQRRSERNELTQDWVLQRLRLFGDAKLTDVMAWDEGGVYLKNSKDLTPEQAYLMTDVTLDETIKETQGGEDLVLKRQKKGRTISDATKLKALELLGKHLGMFKEQLNISGSGGFVPLEVTFKSPDAPS